MGCESWPDTAFYASCPICGERTQRIMNAEPTISHAEGKVLKLYELFDEYYAKRCADLGIPVEGDLPPGYEIPEVGSGT